MSKIIENLPLPPVYYHGREASFWREDDSARWIKINELQTVDFGYWTPLKPAVIGGLVHGFADKITVVSGR